MLPPVPAIVTSVQGKPGDPDELSVLWTFVVNGDPPQVGVAAGDEHIAGGLISMHREFVLNVVRTIFIADVVATSVHEGICDDDGRLRPDAAAFFGMMAGCGEFYTMDRKVGHIGQSVGRKDIRY